MNYFISIIFCISVINASAQVDPFGSGEPARKDDIFKVFPDPDGEHYFPEGKASYYTKYLSAMKEPSIKAPLADGISSVFRFTYLRSFHDPLVVRITENERELTATAIRLKMDRKYQPVKILHNESWTLDAKDSKSVRELLDQVDFWKPFNRSEEELAQGGLDGSMWVFEIHDKDGYKMIDIWSPDSLIIPEATLRKLGLDPAEIRDFLIYRTTGNRFLEIGKILPKPEDMY